MSQTLLRAAVMAACVALGACEKSAVVEKPQVRYNVGPEISATLPESEPATMTKPAASSAANIERRTIYFSGRVQGVGFRATAAQLSMGMAVAGEVRNLPDGRVELVVEGTPGDIDAFVGKVREQFGSYVRSIEQSTSPAKGMPRGVRVTY